MFSIRLLIVLVAFGLCTATPIPEVCTRSKPKSGIDCGDANKTRRFYFSSRDSRCKRFGVCAQAAMQYDEVTGINYFSSMAECEANCTNVVECPEPDLIANGVINGTAYGLDDTISYSCFEGHVLIGDAKRVCQLNGSWSEEEPYCEAQCSTPPPVENANVSPLQSHYPVNSEVTYTCNEGFSGGAGRVCQSDGTWSGPELHCQVIIPECPQPAPIDNGVIDAPCWTAGQNCIVTYTCNKEFILVGRAARRCTDEGKWDAPEPCCAKVELEYDGNDVANKEVRIKKLQEVEVKCLVEPPKCMEHARPVWKVTNGDNFPFGVHTDAEGVLTIRRLTVESALNYTCTVGELQAAVNIITKPDVKVNPVPPLPIIEPVDHEEREGQRADFQCAFQGCPPPDIVWYHNGHPLANDEAGISIVINKFQLNSQEAGFTYCLLTIEAVDDSHSGGYQCVGTNIVAEVPTRNATLEVEQEDDDDDDSSSSRSKRNTETLCNTDPSTVTIVGQVRRSARAVNGVHSYRIQVRRVLRGSAENNGLLEALLIHTQDSTSLAKDTTYVMTGTIINNKLHILDDNSIHSHSPELEDLITAC